MAMELTYATLILKEAKKEVNAENVIKILKSVESAFTKNEVVSFIEVLEQNDLDSLIQNAKLNVPISVKQTHTEGEQGQQNVKKESITENTGIGILFKDEKDIGTGISNLFD